MHWATELTLQLLNLGELPCGQTWVLNELFGQIKQWEHRVVIVRHSSTSLAKPTVNIRNLTLSLHKRVIYGTWRGLNLLYRLHPDLLGLKLRDWSLKSELVDREGPFEFCRRICRVLHLPRYRYLCLDRRLVQ